MSARTLAIDILLAAGVAAQLVCCLGVVLGRTAFDRLHYAGAGATVGPVLILVPILIVHGTASQSLQAIAAVAVLVIAGPIAVHALARAARLTYDDQVEARPEELGPEA